MGKVGEAQEGSVVPKMGEQLQGQPELHVQGPHIGSKFAVFRETTGNRAGRWEGKMIEIDL